ncbi:TetR/AcrR family transcriptional regulator [Paracoccus sp. M683]|uniref:TetR/AcrR family transcriptional regulator n=1 Tax=Paracoccus sp. M683 TaxID=2594268 RepID=UPI00117CCEFC|nr:TetR/AcrR family transcriptional regulator [Paracoccus sp. M683]TRW97535.1 TetR/AcrR family transcriptional regulator [Paracoccus sp. M683]
MQEKSSRTQADRRAATQLALLGAARALFADRGYAGVGAPEIAELAGVTRGAITHHYGDKAGLFQAVVRAEAQAVAAVLAALPDGPLALRQGARLWFQAMADKGRVRILLIDGPAVLGPSEMARIDGATGGGALAQGLAQALPGSDPAKLSALADMLSAGFDRAALRIAEGARPEPYQAGIEDLIARVTA